MVTMILHVDSEDWSDWVVATGRAEPRLAHMSFRGFVVQRLKFIFLLGQGTGRQTFVIFLRCASTTINI